MSHEISPKEFALKKDEYTLIDVREEDELAIAQVKPSLHIPLQSLPLKVDTLDPSKKYVTICHFGRRSQQAADFLAKKGFKVLNLSGGIDRYTLEVDPTLRRY